MDRYIGKLSTDVYGIKIDESRLGLLELTAIQAVANDADAILADQATSASVTTTVTTFLDQPPYPRNIVVTPGGTTADVKAGDVVVTGTNIADEVITESFTFLDDASTAVTGAKAFKTVTSILFPIQDGAAATFDVGFGAKIGLPLMLDYNPVIFACLNGTKEGTAPTVTIDVDELEKNTVALSSALDGHIVKIFMAL